MAHQEQVRVSHLGAVCRNLCKHLSMKVHSTRIDGAGNENLKKMKRECKKNLETRVALGQNHQKSCNHVANFDLDTHTVGLFLSLFCHHKVKMSCTS